MVFGVAPKMHHDCIYVNTIHSPCITVRSALEPLGTLAGAACTPSASPTTIAAARRIATTWNAPNGATSVLRRPIMPLPAPDRPQHRRQLSRGAISVRLLMLRHVGLIKRNHQHTKSPEYGHSGNLSTSTSSSPTPAMHRRMYQATRPRLTPSCACPTTKHDRMFRCETKKRQANTSIHMPMAGGALQHQPHGCPAALPA